MSAHEISELRVGFSPAVEARELKDKTLVLRHLENGEYLTVPSSLRPVIESFDGSRTVESILHQQLAKGTIHGIRAFYDLVMAALNKGLLLEESDMGMPELKPAANEEQTRVFTLHVALSVLMILIGFICMSQMQVHALKHGGDWIVALATVSTGLSLASILAASSMTSFGRRAVLARIRWNRILPFFSINTGDAIMGGRNCEIAVSLRPLAAPFLLATLALVISSPPLLLGSYAVVAILASPFGSTPAHQLLHAMLRKSHSLPLCAESFLETRLVQQVLNWKHRLDEENYLMVHSSYAIVWLGGIFYFANLLLGRHTELIQAMLSGGRQFQDEWLTLTVVGILALVIVGTLLYAAWVIGRWTYRALAPRLFPAESAITKRAVNAAGMDADKRREFLKETLLFSQLPDEALTEAAKVMKVLELKSASTIIRERDPGQTLFVVVSGRVEVTREDESGRPVFVAELGEGDVFGEIAIIDDVPRTSSVTALSDVVLLAMERGAFQETVEPMLGADKVREIVQVSAFLKRNPLFSDWHERALIELAGHFRFKDFNDGEEVIHEGGLNESFFLVYEGSFDVVKGGAPIAKLKPGDFCGEISLLQDTPATAMVKSSGTGRCLSLGKEDFLRFVSHDFLTGIVIERAVEERRAA